MKFKEGDVLAHLTLARSIKITGIYKKRYTYEGTESPGDKLGFVGVGDADLIESNYIIKEEVGAIEEQTIMFWNLQLQFMSMEYLDLADTHHLVIYGCARSVPAWKDHDLLAKELALHLSGLA